MILCVLFLTVTQLVISNNGQDVQLVAAPSDLSTDDFADHPLVTRVEEVLNNASTLFPNAYDPTKTWMKKFLQEVYGPSQLPKTSSSFESLKSNVQRLAEYDHKGYLLQIARGRFDPMKLQYTDESLRPLIIRNFMPTVIEDPDPIDITIDQQVGDVKFINQVPEPNPDVANNESEESESGDKRKRRAASSGISDQVPSLTDEQQEIIQRLVEDNENVLNPTVRNTASIFGTYPQDHTALYVTAIKVALNENTGELDIP